MSNLPKISSNNLPQQNLYNVAQNLPKQSNVNSSIGNRIVFPQIINKNDAQFHSIAGDLSNENQSAENDTELEKCGKLRAKLNEFRSKSAAAGNYEIKNKNSNVDSNISSSPSPLQSNTPSSNLSDYKFGRSLGKGAYGDVYEAAHMPSPSPHSSQSENPHSTPPPVPVALKLIKNASDSSTAYVTNRELRMLEATKGLRHVLQIKGWGTDPKSDQFFIATELLSPLHINPFDLQKIREVAKGIFKGIAELHSKGIIHGDIKPDNCLVNQNGEGVVSDLGTACFTQDNDTHYWPTQTAWYRDPEHFIKSPQNQTIDLWSAGCLLWELAMGKAMFPGEEPITVSDESQRIYYQELHSLHLIEKHLGKLPTDMILQGKQSKKYYERNRESNSPQLKLLPKEYESRMPSRTRYKALKNSCQRAGCSPQVVSYLSELIDKLVTYGEKISATETLNAPFFTNTAAFSIKDALSKLFTHLEIYDETQLTTPISRIDLTAMANQNILCEKSLKDQYRLRFFKGETPVLEMNILKKTPDRITALSLKSLNIIPKSKVA